MIWRKARENDTNENVLVCTETHFSGIAPCIGQLVEHMEANWVAQGFCKEEAVFIDVNATNGHLMCSWDKKGGGACFYDENWPVYYLELKLLWHESLDHAEGAQHFDNQVHIALCCLVSQLCGEAEDAGVHEGYEFYALFEGSTHGAQRVVV